MKRERQAKAPFGARYSEYYDLIYSDKDYDAECIYLEGLLRDYCGTGGKEVLELGCGTGNYTVRLARRGYTVTALDRSAHMLRFARAKAERLGLRKRITFARGEMTRVEFGRSFDACVAMFAILDYLRSARQLRETLARIYRHLRPGGVLVFDVWNGMAVEKEGPSNRVKTVEKGDTRILRVATPRLSVSTERCTVNYTTTVMKRGRLVDKFEESHRLRYFFPRELKVAVESAGYDVLTIHPFMKPTSRVTDKDWSITVVARRPK